MKVFFLCHYPLTPNTLRPPVLCRYNILMTQPCDSSCYFVTQHVMCYFESCRILTHLVRRFNNEPPRLSLNCNTFHSFIVLSCFINFWDIPVEFLLFRALTLLCSWRTKISFRMISGASCWIKTLTCSHLCIAVMNADVDRFSRFLWKCMEMSLCATFLYSVFDVWFHKKRLRSCFITAGTQKESEARNISDKVFLGLLSTV